MEDEREAEDAIHALDRREFGRKGRRLRVEWTKVTHIDLTHFPTKSFLSIPLWNFYLILFTIASTVVCILIDHSFLCSKSVALEDLVEVEVEVEAVRGDPLLIQDLQKLYLSLTLIHIIQG